MRGTKEEREDINERREDNTRQEGDLLENRKSTRGQFKFSIEIEGGGRMKYLNGSFERKPISIIAIAGNELQLSVTLRSARLARELPPRSLKFAILTASR